MSRGITDIPGLKVGHYTDRRAVTGCTVVLCESGAVAGVEVCGSATGTRETDLLHSGSLVTRVQAVLLSGGSAFGLDAAGGVMRYLEERGFGHRATAGVVPIVPAAIIYDLAIGDPGVRPGPEQGYQACLAARDGQVAEGCVGAGTGATVGKILGKERVTKGGLGTWSERAGPQVVVAALAVVNAWGDVVNRKTGQVLAGPRNAGNDGFLSTVELLKEGTRMPVSIQNTTLCVVATDARLTKEGANKVARMAAAGIARAVNPCFTMSDGDVVFALSLGEKDADVTTLGVVAAEAVSEAIQRAVLSAETLAGVPAVRDIVR